jgi:homospermidine synthase
MFEFPNRILFVGFGAVARCTLPILLKHIRVDPRNITIINFEPNDLPVALAAMNDLDAGATC